MRDIYLSMVTHPRPVDYFSQTIKNLVRSGLGRSSRLCNFGIYETHEPANINVADALSLQACDVNNWILFIEDDLDFCNSFVDSCAAWLDEHEYGDVKVYAFGCSHPAIEDSYEPYWKYPISCFNGTQCFAVRRYDALEIAKYLRKHCYDRTPDGTAYDLLIADWARANWPDQEYFLASCPSFVQHVGMNSVIRPRPNVHTFTSFPGPEWSYV